MNTASPFYDVISKEKVLNFFDKNNLQNWDKNFYLTYQYKILWI